MIRDVVAQNRSLDNDYGTTRGSNAAASHALALFDENGVELAGAGYARKTVAPADWAAAANGAKSVVVTFAAPTGEWVPATSWALIGSDGLRWDDGDFLDPVTVTASSSTGPVVTVTVYYATAEGGS